MYKSNLLQLNLAIGVSVCVWCNEPVYSFNEQETQQFFFASFVILYIYILPHLISSIFHPLLFLVTLDSLFVDTLTPHFIIDRETIECLCFRYRSKEKTEQSHSTDYDLVFLSHTHTYTYTRARQIRH